MASLALALGGSAARAGDDAPAPPPDDSVVKKAFKLLDFATDPGEPQDFVVKARPRKEQDYVPIGRKDPGRRFKVKTPDELKAMEADFDAVKTAHDALRAKFPPAVEAVAAAEAAKAAKANKPKPKPPEPANPQ